MSPKIARLAGLGAFGACVAFVVLFAYVCFLSVPTTTGGILGSTSNVVYISLLVVTIALIAAHIAIARQLMYIASDGAPRPV